MREKLQDVAELLKMLEMVFGQAERHPGERFPWAGVRLTLRQAQDFLQEHLATSREGVRAPEPRAEERREVQKNLTPRNEEMKPSKRPDSRPPFATPSRTSSPNSVEAPIRGTFNRVQLTEEPLEETGVAKSL